LETCQVLADIDEGGVRTVEVAEVLGFGETTVCKLLGPLKAKGDGSGGRLLRTAWRIVQQQHERSSRDSPNALRCGDCLYLWIVRYTLATRSQQVAASVLVLVDHKQRPLALKCSHRDWCRWNRGRRWRNQKPGF
jgi:hypothetical protein